MNVRYYNYYNHC